MSIVTIQYSKMKGSQTGGQSARLSGCNEAQLQQPAGERRTEKKAQQRETAFRQGWDLQNTGFGQIPDLQQTKMNQKIKWRKCIMCI